ncbi:hypothetical protein [Paractinoplanes toevensis]|uniref:Uncharacterized protein n=1 Tax=Paractinoplanes toevensis TaxID=571911 RepID=A0A919W075_9ACTN|nr:hypothetical protein [Actinoplanes toevensis]GIM88879.1 hypothetical protein Ato02nite_006720 [Actinoplanes toevensis]
MTADILTDLDRAIAGSCPCGAEPRPDSPYCSYDCEPNWRGDDTISDVDRTPMRWRPDLVTEAENLPLLDSYRRGQHHAQVFDRPGTDRIHLRLDDGHRFVGCDIQAGDNEGQEAAWARLERELGNRRHLEPAEDDAWADIAANACSCGCDGDWRMSESEIRVASHPRFPQWLAQAVERAEEHQRSIVVAQSRAADPRARGTVFIAPVDAPLDRPSQWVPLGTVVDDGINWPLGGDVRSGPVTVRLDNVTGLLAPPVVFGPLRTALAGMARTFELTSGQIDAMIARVLPDRWSDAETEDEPEHPLARMNARRQNTSHGPQQTQRPPRQIRPRGR